MSAPAFARASPEQSDERLAVAAAEGDETAFEALVLRYRRPLLRYSRRLGLSEARAEDVAQQSLMRAWISLQQGVAVTNVSAWLYRIAHNATIDALRGSATSHEQLTDAATEIVAVSADPERAVALREVFADLAALPAMQREALLCTAVEGRTNEQTALALGLSSGAVRGLVYRARATLRAAVSAVAPPSILGWASAAVRRGSRFAQRVTKLEVGRAGAGVATGGIVKGGAALLAAGAIVLGVTAVRHAPTPSRGLRRSTPAAAGAASDASVTRAVGTPALPAGTDRPRTGASRGARHGGLDSASAVRSVAENPVGSGSPLADGREVASPSGGGSGTSASTPAASKSGSPKGGAGGVAGTPPVSGSHRTAAPPIPPRKGGNPGQGGAGGSSGSPNLVSVGSGSGALPGGETAPERGGSAGGEATESSGGHESSTPPRKTAPPL